MASINSLQAEYGFDHFFAVSHGKGAVDRIGRSVKKPVWIAVKSRKAIVNSALEFYNLARTLSKNIIFRFAAKEEVEERIALLDDQWERLKNIPGIQSKDFFQSDEVHSISVARTSLSHFKCTLVLKSPKSTGNTDSVPSVRANLYCHFKRLSVSDIYSDSDSEFINDKAPSKSLQALKLSPEA
ncbi:hypothetical protein HHI36_000639 [Cryptolaemus montrouzieri]|uniref:Uncharacterized protein n=1 Tax=Cryptolaemus montrouzieri TaxID=559131 RepID=A0ABD2P5D1_9CUCU